ncbi:hypothetical protein Cal6303_1399 [Calothrix sp. PCC 6303]|nr:hypothetical protein Cal6303_1399 [Calothrix sp. PCC 6303]
MLRLYFFLFNTNSNNDCNRFNGGDVALLGLYKYLSVTLFFQIGIIYADGMVTISRKSKSNGILAPIGNDA